MSLSTVEPFSSGAVLTGGSANARSHLLAIEQVHPNYYRQKQFKNISPKHLHNILILEKNKECWGWKGSAQVERFQKSSKSPTIGLPRNTTDLNANICHFFDCSHVPKIHQSWGCRKSVLTFENKLLFWEDNSRGEPTLQVDNMSTISA